MSSNVYVALRLQHTKYTRNIQWYMNQRIIFSSPLQFIFKFKRKKPPPRGVEKRKRKMKPYFLAFAMIASFLNQNSDQIESQLNETHIEMVISINFIAMTLSCRTKLCQLFSSFSKSIHPCYQPSSQKKKSIDTN